MTRVCAFLSMDNLEGFVADDGLLAQPMAQAGWSVQTLSWKAAGFDWNRFEAVVIRSTWDYQSHLEQFLETLEAIERSRARLFNPMDLVRWNVRKTYLFDLSRRGVEIVPTLLVRDGWADCFEKLGTEEIVVKPVVGANAENTFRIPSPEAFRILPEVEALFSGSGALVQPFLPSIVEEGEFSLLFFGGEFSHGILKTPRPGDFRVQEEHGGWIRPIEPEPDLLEAGRRALSALSSQPLYARVDLARAGEGRFLLMELELVEPSLYLRMNKQAPERFVRMFSERMATKDRPIQSSR